MLRALRHWATELAFGDMLATHGESGSMSTSTGTSARAASSPGPYLSRIEAKRSALYQRLCGFQKRYDFFVLPVNQVLPFDVKPALPYGNYRVKNGELTSPG